MDNIIGNLPDSLANGTEADASQVMANLNFIVNAVNANALSNAITTLALTTLTASTSVSVTGGTVSVTQSTSSDGLSINGSANAQGASIQMIGNGGATPSKTLHVQSGAFYITNDAYNDNILSLDDSGDLTVTGVISGSNVAASSDERLKKDWAALPGDFIERLAEVTHGTYTRIDTGERQAGVSAQSLKKVLPEAVLDGDLLSVAYGHAALVAVIELTREVLRLRALLEPVK